LGPSLGREANRQILEKAAREKHPIYAYIYIYTRISRGFWNKERELAVTVWDANQLNYVPANLTVGIETTNLWETKEFCGAPWSSKELKRKERNS
jgi:hypothetical protein